MFHPRRLRALRGTDEEGNQVLLCLDCYIATDEGPERKMKDDKELEAKSSDGSVSSK